MAVAFVTVGTLLGVSPLKGIASLLIGLTIGLVGIETADRPGPADVRDPGAARRHRRGHRRGRAVRDRRGRSSTRSRAAGGGTVQPLHGKAVMSREDWRRSWPAWLRGTAFGFPIGALPAGGAEIPTFLSYATERRLSKHKDEFGHGAIEGVAGPGGGQQRGRRRRAGAAADDRPAHLGHGRGDPHRVPVLRPAAGAAAVQRVRAAGLRAARQPLHRQRDAAGAEPAARAGLGAAAADPGVRRSTPASWSSRRSARWPPAAAWPTCWCST